MSASGRCRTQVTDLSRWSTQICLVDDAQLTNFESGNPSADGRAMRCK
jgi:hypothetical protein